VPLLRKRRMERHELSQAVYGLDFDIKRFYTLQPRDIPSLYVIFVSSLVNSKVPRKDEKCRLVYYIITLEVLAKETFNNSKSDILLEVTIYIPHGL
jgi:hypothetical protein